MPYTPKLAAFGNSFTPYAGTSVTGGKPSGEIDIEKLNNIPSETKAIIVVHNFGTVVNVNKIKQIINSDIKFYKINRYF